MAKMIIHRDIREIVKALEAQGCTVERSNGKHIKVYKDGNFVFSLPSTPGRGRWKQNLEASLRRLDLHV